MTEILCTGPVVPAAMQDIVAACDFAEDALFLGEQLPTRIIGLHEREDTLMFSSLVSSPPCAAYSSGRVFQNDRELRWERQGERMHIVYLGPEEYSAAMRAYGLKQSKALDTLAKRAEPAYYYLFGERLRPDDLATLGKVARPGDFAVVRIPRILRYPVTQNGQRYARLVVCEYEEATTGSVALFRFQRLETVEK